MVGFLTVASPLDLLMASASTPRSGPGRHPVRRFCVSGTRFLQSLVSSTLNQRFRLYPTRSSNRSACIPCVQTTVCFSSQALIQRFKAAGLRVVANLKPCLLNDHPRYADAENAGAFVRNADTGRPSTSQFWDGEGAHLDFLTAAAVKWWQTGLREAILEYGIDSAWNDNNEYELWDEEAECGGDGLRAGVLGENQGLAQGFPQGLAASGRGKGAGNSRAANSEEPAEVIGGDHITPQVAGSSINPEAASPAVVAEKEVGPVEVGHVAAGRSVRIVLARPVLALLMTRASYEEQVRFQPDERPYTITRAGCPGVQRYGQTWSGDNTTRWKLQRIPPKTSDCQDCFDFYSGKLIFLFLPTSVGFVFFRYFGFVWMFASRRPSRCLHFQSVSNLPSCRTACT